MNTVTVKTPESDGGMVPRESLVTESTFTRHETPSPTPVLRQTAARLAALGVAPRLAALRDMRDDEHHPR